MPSRDLYHNIEWIVGLVNINGNCTCSNQLTMNRHTIFLNQLTTNGYIIRLNQITMNGSIIHSIQYTIHADDPVLALLFRMRTLGTSVYTQTAEYVLSEKCDQHCYIGSLTQDVLCN